MKRKWIILNENFWANKKAILRERKFIRNLRLKIFTNVQQDRNFKEQSILKKLKVKISKMQKDSQTLNLKWTVT